MRRILRVFPLYYLSLFVFLILLPQISNLPIRLDYFTQNQAWLWTYLQNWLYIFIPSNKQDALNHLWSLAVEEQFYLLWPVAIALLRKPKLILWFISVVLLITIGLRIMLWINQVENLAYYNLYTFTRIDGICIGCMVALLQKINFNFLNKYTSLIVFLFAGFNFVFYFVNRQYQWTFPYLGLIGYTTVAMLFGLLVYNMANNQTRIFNTIFNIKPLKFIGMISYSCYVIHWPLYLILRPYLEKWYADNIHVFSERFFASFIATLLAYSLGYLSYRYFEKPFLRLKTYFT